METRAGDVGKVTKGMYVALITTGGQSLLFPVQKGAKIRVGKKNLDPLGVIGHKFGTFFDLSQGKFTVMDSIPNLVEEKHVDLEEKGDNRNLLDDNTAQSLSKEDIQKIKEESTTGEAVVSALAEHNKSFQEKTGFSKEKYIKRKRNKYAVYGYLMPPTLQIIAEVAIVKRSDKIMNLRFDSLGLLLARANIQPGGRTLVFETVTGLLLGAVADRMRGIGEIFNLFSGGMKGTEVMKWFNLTKQETANIKHLPLATLTAEESEDDDEDTQQLREEANKGFDSLIVATKFCPVAVVPPLLHFLRPSSPFAIFSKTLQPLATLQAQLQQSGRAVQVQLVDLWTRYHQVLPMRTHPEMNMHGNSGYVLAGYTIVPQGSSLPAASLKRAAEEIQEESDKVQEAPSQPEPSEPVVQEGESAIVEEDAGAPES